MGKGKPDKADHLARGARGSLLSGENGDGGMGGNARNTALLTMKFRKGGPDPARRRNPSKKGAVRHKKVRQEAERKRYLRIKKSCTGEEKRYTAVINTGGCSVACRERVRPSPQARFSAVQRSSAKRNRDLSYTRGGELWKGEERVKPVRRRPTD